jgi:hypothetical protein
MEMVLDLLPRLPLAAMVSHRIPFEDAASAYRLLDDSPGETAQVILTYDST